MVAKRKWINIWFQPKKRIQLDFYEKGIRIGSHIFEDVVVPFFPNCPHTSKPNYPEEWMRRSRHTYQMNKLFEMCTNRSRWNISDTYPLPRHIPNATKDVTSNKEMLSCLRAATSGNIHNISWLKHSTPHQIIFGRKTISK